MCVCVWESPVECPPWSAHARYTRETDCRGSSAGRRSSSRRRPGRRSEDLKLLAEVHTVLGAWGGDPLHGRNGRGAGIVLAPHHTVGGHHVASHLLEPSHVVGDGGELSVAAHVVREVLHAHVAVVGGGAIVLVPGGAWTLATGHVVGGRLHAVGGGDVEVAHGSQAGRGPQGGVAVGVVRRGRRRLEGAVGVCGRGRGRCVRRSVCGGW